MFGRSPVQGSAVEHTSGWFRALPLRLYCLAASSTRFTQPRRDADLSPACLELLPRKQLLVAIGPTGSLQRLGIPSKLRHRID